MSINATLQAERYRDPSRIVFGLRTDDEGNPINEPEQAFAVPRDVLKEGHIHIRGRTRSGKTSLAIAPLLRQLIRPYPYYNTEGEVLDSHMQDPIFIFDLGGDLSLFNFIQKLCDTEYKDASRRKFRFLSLKQNDDWHYFDPFQIVPSGEQDIIRLAQILIEAFNQDHGLLYGAAYYSMKSLSALLRIADRVVKKSKAGTHLDFHQVGKYLDNEPRPDRDEAQIRMAFQFLMQYKQLQLSKDGQDRQIDMRRALDDSEVIYFFCPSMGQATTARQVAGLGLYTLLAAAQLRKDSGANREAGHRHAWVIVDEFHELAGRSFASLLAQSSKFGISLILANQTTTQLETRDLNLAHVIRDNTLAKIYFTVTGKTDFDDLQGFSLEHLQEIPGMSITQKSGLDTTTTESISHKITTQLKRDEILSTSATGNNCFMILDDGSGHREPLRLFTDYTITKKDFEDYKNQPIPQRQASIAVAPEPKSRPSATLAPEATMPAPSQDDSMIERNDTPLIQLLREKEQQEQPNYIKQYYCGQAG